MAGGARTPGGKLTLAVLIAALLAIPLFAVNLIVAALLAALYAVLYVLLSLEAYSLLIGSLLLFAALAGVMYLTRNLDWSGLRPQPSSD